MLTLAIVAACLPAALLAAGVQAERYFLRRSLKRFVITGKL